MHAFCNMFTGCVLLAYDCLLSLQPISLSDQTMTHGFRDGLRPISDLQLTENILHLAFYRDLAPEQVICMFLVDDIPSS